MVLSREGSSMRLRLRCQLGLQSPEGLADAGGPVYRMAHSHGFGQEASSVLCPVDLSIKAA